MKKLIIQLIKFGIVGVIATLIDLAVLMVLKEILDVDVLAEKYFWRKKLRKEDKL